MTLQDLEPIRRLVLLAATEPALRATVDRLAADLRFEVFQATGLATALKHIADVRPHVTLVDLEIPGTNGFDVLRAIREIDPLCGVVLVSPNGSANSAVNAVRLGALGYVTKPLDVERLRDLIVAMDEALDRRASLLQMDVAAARRLEFEGMIGRSAVMQELFETIRRLAPHTRTVLVTGEAGTGKGLVARAFQSRGPRRSRPLLSVDCAGADDRVFDGSLSDGTLVLDEIAELPQPLQTRAWTAIQSGAVHVVATTNRDLRSEVAAGRFRGDLFRHLDAIRLHVPPLRERPEDIPLLTGAFIGEFASQLNRPIAGTTIGAERVLMHAPWDGNVRELRAVVERACRVGASRLLAERDIAAAMRELATRVAPGNWRLASTADDSRLSSAQRAQIERVLGRVGGNKTEAARRLGISRRALYRWLERFDRVGGGSQRSPSKPPG